MRILDNLDIKFLNKNIVILLAFGIIFFLSIDLRLYNLSKVYTEYDDIGVLALHKGVASSREAEGDFWVFKKTFVFDAETLQNIEKSYLFPFYIAWGWTYSPGQYALYPMILSDDDSYEMKVFKGRFFSAAASIITVLLLFGIFIKLNNGLSWAAMLPVSIFSFSQNSILYGHHMGPYSTYCLATTLGLFLIYLATERKISTYTCCLLNTVLLYFSYMNILIFIPLLYVEYHRKNIKAFILSYFSEKKYLLFFNVMLIVPILITLAMKLKHTTQGSLGMRGLGIPQIIDFTTIISVPFIVLKQLFLASESLFSGFFPIEISSIYLLFFLIVMVVTLYLGLFRIQFPRRIFFLGLILYFLQWLSFYMASKLPLDGTRHALIFFPVLLAITFVCFNHLKLPNLFYVAFCLIAIPYSYVEAKSLIDRKANNLNFEFIEKQNVDHIFLYDTTLSPLLYFEGKKKVVNVDMDSFIKIYKNYKMPESFLFVSQHKSLKEYKPVLKKRFPEIFMEYIGETLMEKKYGTVFPIQ